jgi:hypothetical protein
VSERLIFFVGPEASSPSLFSLSLVEDSANEESSSTSTSFLFSLISLSSVSSDLGLVTFFAAFLKIRFNII